MTIQQGPRRAAIKAQTSALPEPQTQPKMRFPAIVALGTALPEASGSQEEIGEWMAASFGERSAQGRILRALCRESGIERRYSCAPHYLAPPQECRFAPGVSADRSPSTAERMAIYEQAAAPLGAQAAQAAFADYAQSSGLSPQDVAGQVTHLIVVSCTGFYAPGLDFGLAKRLGLRATVERSLIGFMGCSAVFNALRAAHAVVRADPQALALVVSVELCTLHSQPNPQRDHLLGSSLFGDGASACLVALPDQTRHRPHGDAFVLEKFLSQIKPESEEAMAWQIGNYGFNLRLSPSVPDQLSQAAPAALADLFGAARPGFWAIHPGGRAIVDRLADIFDLDPEQVAASRHVLRSIGNVSSATILFVLAEMRRRLRAQPSSSRPQQGVAMAFGPGLVLELARLTYLPLPRQHARHEDHAADLLAAAD